MLRMGLTMGYPIPTYGKIVFPMRTCYVFWVKLDFRHNQFCNDSHAKPISFISVPSKCFPRIGVVWSCPRKEGRLVVWQMKYVTDTTILYIYIYTYYIYPNPEMMPFSLRVHLTCFFVEIWGRLPKNAPNWMAWFHGYHIVQPPHSLFDLPAILWTLAKKVIF